MTRLTSLRLSFVPKKLRMILREMSQSVPREFTLPRRIGALIHEARRKRMFDKLSTFRNLYGVGNAFDGKRKKD